MKMYQIMTRLPVLTCLYNIIFYSQVTRYHDVSLRMLNYCFSLTFVCVTHLTFYFIFHKEVLNMERKWNKMEILRLTLNRNSVQSKTVQISDLKVGDVVFLRGDTISPADIMVIDTSNQRHSDKIFHVSERRITGDNKIMTKRAIRNLNPQKSDKAPRSISNIANKNSEPNMADKILKKFNGYVEYDAPNSFIDFVGSFRLKNDPRVSKVSKENILFCGTKLYTSWIIGMVVYNGFYTKIMQRNYNQTLFSKDLFNFKKSVIYLIIDRISLISFLASIFISFVVVIMVALNKEDYFRLQFINETDKNSEFFNQLGFQLSYAFEMMPIGLYVLYDLSCFLCCATVENLWGKSFVAAKAKIKAYITAMQIKCKKKGPRAARKENLSFVKMNSPEKFERMKNGFLSFGYQKPTQQLGVDHNPADQNLSDSGKISPSDLLKNTVDVSVKSGPKKTTMNKTQMISGSDISASGNRDFIKIIDYSVIPDLGNIDHVVFDKTDTLTTSHLEIVNFTSVIRCYAIETGKIAEKLIEIATPGNNLALNDSQDEEIKERGSYSEKSQEYLDELEGDYRPEICDEDSTWTEMIRGLEQPSYNLDVGGQGSHAHLTVIGQSMIEDSPAAKLNGGSSVAGFFNERGKITRRIGNAPDDFLNLSKRDMSMSKKNTLNMMKSALDERAQNKSFGGEMSSRQIVQEMSDQESDNSSNESDSFKLYLKPSKVMPMDKFIRDVYFKREEIERFLGMVAVFNRFTFEGERNSKAQAMEDKAIADMLKNIGYQLSSSKKNKESTIDAEFRVKCSTTNYSVEYRVVGVNFFSHVRERASIVLSDMSQNTGEAYILVKGLERSMMGLMNISDRDKNILRELSANYKSQGLKQIIYGIKKLSYEEVLSYKSSYTEILKSPRDQKEGFELLALDVEKNLKFIGCFGIRDIVCPEGLAFSQVLRDIGIKFSILSGDNKDNCLNIARTLELTKSGMEESGITFNISSTEEEEIGSSMKRIVDQIYDDMKKLNQDEMKRADIEMPQKTTPEMMILENIKQRLLKTSGDAENEWQEEAQDILNFEFDPLSFRNLSKRTLLLNGQSINKIISTPFLLTQLRCILIFCSSVVGYSMQPSHKATIVKLLRSNKNVVLAVGDGFNDIRMIREANVGVQLANNDVPVVFSDIVVGSIATLHKVMFSRACSFSKNLMMGYIALFWIVLTQLYLYSIIYLKSTYLSEFSRSDTKLLRVVYVIVISCICILDEPYKGNVITMFPILYRESVITRRHFKAIMLSIIVFSMIETIIVYCIFIFFLSGSQNQKGYTRGVYFFENFIAVISTVSCFLKIYYLRNDRTPTITVLLAIVAIGIFPIVLVENNMAPLLEASLYSDIFSDSTVLACVILCILVPGIINWIIVTLLQINYASYLVHHLSFVNKLIDKHPEKGNSKKDDTGGKIHFLNESLKEMQTKRYIGSFHITNLVNMVRKISNNQAISVSIGKIISIDLFNYQTGLIKFSNYIKERVDRSRFRNYLMYVMKKNTRTQLTLYIILYGAALVVGMSTSIFRNNYMLDTTVPYMIMMIGFMIWINASVVYYTKLFKYFIAMGIVSLLFFVVLSSTTLNRFEQNFIDMYSGRIWFSVCLEMIDASMLAVTHIFVKILRFNTSHPVADFEGVTEAKHTISLLIYYGLLIMLKYKSDKLVKKDFLAKSRLRLDIKKSREKLTMLMPEFVLERINTFEVADNFIADDAGEICIIFCDICYFDDLIKDCKDKIIDILEDVFRNFDGMCKNFGVQKIETVGKTYMACAGLKFIDSKLDAGLKSTSSTMRGLNFAYNMMQFANNYSYRAGKTLRMKIGIHYGTCIYGLLGYHKPQFSLIGDTINTTSRHCTTGKPGHIILSNNAFNQLEPKLIKTIKFEKDKLEMKGKGMVDTFSINLYGSQKTINKKLDPNKIMYSIKSNVSMQSIGADKNERYMRRQSSVISRKSGNHGDIKSKYKSNQVGKSATPIGSHLKGKYTNNLIVSQSVGQGLINVAYNRGSSPNFMPLRLPLSFNDVEPHLPVEDIFQQQLQNQNAVGILLSNSQPFDQHDENSNKKEGAACDEDLFKKENSASFEDFKSEQSLDSNSDNPNRQVKTLGNSLNKETQSKPKGSQTSKLEYTEQNMVRSIKPARRRSTSRVRGKSSGNDKEKQI